MYNLINCRKKYKSYKETKVEMKIEYYLYKKNIKRIILLFILLVMVSLCTSKTFASTIDSSNISINIDANGVCYIEEMLYITAIDETSAYTWNYAQYPSMQLTRGGIEKLCINNLELSDYYNKWWTNRDNYYDDYFSTINLFYPRSRKISIFIILHKKNENNFL